MRRAPCSAARHSGSRGTDTSRWRRATRAISETVCSGSGTCSRTSIAVARSNSSSSNGRRSGGIVANRRLSRRRVSHSARSLGSSRSRPSTGRLAEPLRPAVGQHPLAAADVEHRLRGGALEQPVQRPLKPGHQPPHDRVARAVLVERVAGRDGLADAHAFSAPWGTLVIPRAPRGRAARPARSARAGRRAAARCGGRARTCAATACAARRAGRRSRPATAAASRR